MTEETARLRVLAFGEAMVRLTPPNNERLERTQQLDLSPGGAELNTAVTLACLGIDAAWVSSLPDNGLGRFLDRQARAHGVDMSRVNWVSEDTGRMGLYFLEEATDPRPSAVTYDRAESAFARINHGDFSWPDIMAGVNGFHISGITPAVSANARAETMNAIRAANAAGVPVFFDLNYRSKLWTESEARECFLEIAPMVDILFAGRGSLRKFFGLDAEDRPALLELARSKLGVAACVMTRKKSKASRSLSILGQAIGPDGEIFETDWEKIEVVDRLGGGDAFAGGFIAGYLEESGNLSRALDLGLAASALKHTIRGDFLCATRAEIEAAASGSGAGVLQR